MYEYEYRILLGPMGFVYSYITCTYIRSTYHENEYTLEYGANHANGAPRTSTHAPNTGPLDPAKNVALAQRRG